LEFTSAVVGGGVTTERWGRETSDPHPSPKHRGVRSGGWKCECKTSQPPLGRHHSGKTWTRQNAGRTKRKRRRRCFQRRVSGRKTQANAVWSSGEGGTPDPKTALSEDSGGGVVRGVCEKPSGDKRKQLFLRKESNYDWREDNLFVLHNNKKRAPRGGGGGEKTHSRTRGGETDQTQLALEGPRTGG